MHTQEQIEAFRSMIAMRFADYTGEKHHGNERRAIGRLIKDRTQGCDDPIEIAKQELVALTELCKTLSSIIDWVERT